MKIFDAIIASVFFLSIAWALFLMDEYLGYNLTKYGLIPRNIDGLFGIISMHFLHGGLDHIWHNTLAFIVLNTFLFYFYRSISIKTFFFLFFFSGIMLWLIGRPTVHIGASMMIYGEFAFLFLSGIIRKNPTLARVTLVVGLYYGSLVWYLFPVDAKISWEGHLSGFVVGLIAAVLFRNQGPPRKVYRYEVEPELSDENPYWLENGKMGKWGNGEMGKWGNGEMGKWGNGEMEKWENGKMRKWGNGKMRKRGPRQAWGRENLNPIRREANHRWTGRLYITTPQRKKISNKKREMQRISLLKAYNLKPTAFGL